MTTLFANQTSTPAFEHHQDEGLVDTIMPTEGDDNAVYNYYFVDLHTISDFKDEEINNNMRGYLHKTGRSGKEQHRYFSINNDDTLSYCKSQGSGAALATLHLAKTGAIIIANDSDPSACTFSIDVLDRPYFIKAESSELCSEWVVELNRIKSKLDNAEKNEFSMSSPTSVVIPSRRRTRAVHGVEEWSAAVAVWKKKYFASRIRHSLLQWARSILGATIKGSDRTAALTLDDAMLTGELV